MVERDTTAALTLSFEGEDPLWYESTQRSYDFVAGMVVPFFPIFPVRLMVSSEYAEGSVENSGDEDSWPIWTISGPAEDLVIVNNTTGKTIDLTGITVPDAGQLIIDCNPAAKSVLLDGIDSIATLTLASELFPLALGANSITVKLNNPDSGTTVNVAFTRRYFTP